jgi:hypothetical protein
LLIAREDAIYTFAAIILSLIWLKVSRIEFSDEYGEKRVARHLFGKLGEWLDQGDAITIFDDAQSKYLGFERNIEDDDYKAIVRWASMADFLRGIASRLLHAYLVFVIFEMAVST